ncbi:MAG: thiamine pyrophosphate-dependent enzyme [Alphaproteobacteria bacterium]|nr:thiamine pyrophosphate-dependent enzyme [Alphaproteobacteria bacterium]
MNRREAVARLIGGREDILVVTGLGSPTYDVAAAGEKPNHFYLWGAMGGAAMVGLGLALAQPKKPVVVVTGDGEQLMGLGGFATVGTAAPKNLHIVVLDNELYGETGNQATHTGQGTDLAAVAMACGVGTACVVQDLDGIDAIALDAESGPSVTVLKVAQGDDDRVLPNRDGPSLARDFRRHVTGQAVD